MFAVPQGSYHAIKLFCVNFFESYGKVSTDVFISKKSIVIRNGKTENLATLDIHALFISNAFFKSTSPVDTGHKLNVHKTFRRRPGRSLSTGSVLLNFFMN